MTKLRLVMVTWRDACSIDGWRSPADEDFDTADVVSVGWLLERTKKKIVLASSMCSEGGVNSVVVIPTPWVGSVRKLKEPR